MNRISSAESPNKCSTCVLGQFCLPVGLSADDANKIDTLVTERVHDSKYDEIGAVGMESGELMIQSR